MAAVADNVTCKRPVVAWSVVVALAAAACSSHVASLKPGTVPSSPAAAAGSPLATTTTVPSTTTTAATTAPAAAVSAGRWSDVGLIVNGQPTLLATLIQGRPGGPSTGVVRINGAVTRMVLYAGTAEPGGTWPNQGAIPASADGLVAAFNSGFHTNSSGGGWYDHARVAVALRSGAASLVIRADGTATVGMWDRDVSLTADVVSVRQNLVLLVDNGADVSATGSWGAVLGGGIETWRSGLGVDAAGNLLYAAGAGLDPSTLARVLIDCGAVRAMELDINPEWVAFAYYTGASSGTDLLPAMHFGPDHWLAGSARDFFSVVAR
ncbi:MAG: hypothetical protein ACRDZ8_07975 [Acidimicrobiales bacterium]